jgi:hypothetical protein
MPRPLSRVIAFFAIVAVLSVLWTRTLKNAAAADPGNVRAVQPAAAAPAPTRIGTYDGRAIAVAFAPSATHNNYIAELSKRAKEAEAAGDIQKVAELRAKGRALQTVRHLQAFANAPVDDILHHVRDKLPDVAQKAGVCAIVRGADFYDPSVETVDVTDQLVALFNPSERTLKTVKDIRKKMPLALETVLIAEREEQHPRK